jgi:uncharacterized protein YybS (DUF2232 family)
LNDSWVTSNTTLKHSCLALACSLFLFLAAVMIPVAGILLMLLVPQPLLVLGGKHGWRALLGTTMLAGVAVLALSGFELGLSYLVVASLAVFLLFALDQDRSLERIVLMATTGFFAFGFVIAHTLAGSLANLHNAIRDTLGQNLALALKFYESAGVSGEGTEYLREHLSQLVELILQVLPALAFTGCAVAVLLNLLALLRRLPDARGRLLPDADPKEWKSPELLIWCFIVSGFCLLVLPYGWVRVLCLNLFLVSMVCYFFQGLAIVAYYFHHKRVPIFLRGIGYALIFLEQFFTLLVVGLGLFDLWGDFRRLNKSELGTTHAS